LKEHEVVLRVFKLINAGEDAEAELKKLGDFLTTRSQLASGVEYLSVSKINRGDVKGLIIIRGSRENALSEAELISSLVKSNFKTIDVEVVSEQSVLSNILTSIKNFF
jgi:hypothetical protein